MNIKYLFTAFASFLLLGTAVPQVAQAQWGIGASYEIRDKIPENGFGVRLERGILQGLPILDLGLRAHFSYFSDDNNVSEGSISYSEDVTDYDFGITALAGVNIGLVKPYVGVGLGSNTVDVNYKDVSGVTLEDGNDSKVYWNALVGAELSPIPVLKPFVEYRYSDVGKKFFENVTNATERDSYNGRLIFGILLSF